MTSMDDHVKEMSRRRCERMRCQKRDRNTKRDWRENIYIYMYMYMNDGEKMRARDSGRISEIK